MKATLEFNLPEDRLEYNIYHNAINNHSVLFELAHNFMKKQEQYLDSKEHASDEEYAFLNKIKEDIANLLEANEVWLWVYLNHPCVLTAAQYVLQGLFTAIDVNLMLDLLQRDVQYVREPITIVFYL